MVDFSLRGKVAIITGASRGIGRAIALAYAQAGASVTICCRTEQNLGEAVKEIEESGGQVQALQAHMGEPQQVRRLVDETLERWGRVDIAVNNAATNPHYGPALTAQESQIDKILDVNLKGYFRLAQAVVPHLSAQGGGKIINLASVAGLFPSHYIGLYGVSKAAVVMLTQVLARELGPHNIQVNAIAPGIIKTRFSRALWEDEKRMARYREATPLGRLGTPEDVAAAALYLAAPASDWVTGTVLIVDGGASLAAGL